MKVPKELVTLVSIAVSLSGLPACAATAADKMWENFMQEAESFKKQGNYAQAEKNYMAALHRALQVKDGADIVIQSYDALGTMRVAQGRYDVAEPMFKRAIACYNDEIKGESGKLQQETVESMLREKFYLADCLRAEAKYKQAEAEYRDALKVYHTRNLANPLLKARIQSELGDTLSVQQKYPEAEALYKEAIPVFESTHSWDLLLDLLQDYDALLRVTNRTADAERIEAQLTSVRKSLAH